MEKLVMNIVKIEEFIQRPYPIIIRELDRKVCLFVPQLQIFVEAETVQNAYELLKKEKLAFYKRLEEIDSLHLISEFSNNGEVKQKNNFKNLFIERALSFVMTLAFWILLLALIGHQVKKTTAKIQEAFVPVSQEKSQERLLHFKEKINIAAPYLKEIKKAFNE
jgi:hypothetical protein